MRMMVALTVQRATIGSMQDYRHIKAWQRGHVVAIAIHKLARRFGNRGFPTLRSQLSRAADSVPSNIVEGCRTESTLKFASYLQNSIDSANEVEYRLQVAYDLQLISEQQWRRLTNEIVEIRKMTYGYRKKVLANAEPDGDRRQRRREANRRSAKHNADFEESAAETRVASARSDVLTPEDQTN